MAGQLGGQGLAQEPVELGKLQGPLDHAAQGVRTRCGKRVLEAFFAARLHGLTMDRRYRMNVIIVAKFLKAPKKLVVRDPRVVLALTAVFSVVLGLGAAIGYFSRNANAGAMEELARLRGMVDEQQRVLEESRATAEREINALAVRLAELQATATRLNALGERLTRVGQLEEGEFDFTEPPAMGGPEQVLESLPAMDTLTLEGSMADLAAQFAWQSEQLSLLESLLMDRELTQALTPSGRPVNTGYASSAFGYRNDPFSGKRSFHRGVDFHAARGSDVLAVADGVVSYVGKRSGYGNVVELDHGNGYMTRYGHNQENLVELGQRIRSGDVIAKMGSTGRSTGSHVHFEVWLNDKVVNPYQYLKSAKG